MKHDPAIDDIRKTREEISARFGHDTKRLIEHYQGLEARYKDRMRRRTQVEVESLRVADFREQS